MIQIEYNVEIISNHYRNSGRSLNGGFTCCVVDVEGLLLWCGVVLGEVLTHVAKPTGAWQVWWWWGGRGRMPQVRFDSCYYFKIEWISVIGADILQRVCREQGVIKTKQFQKEVLKFFVVLRRYMVFRISMSFTWLFAAIYVHNEPVQFDFNQCWERTEEQLLRPFVAFLD